MNVKRNYQSSSFFYLLLKKIFLRTTTLCVPDDIDYLGFFCLQCNENRCVANALDKSSHDYELELLKKEKEEALAEEVKTTKAGKEFFNFKITWFCFQVWIHK